MFTLQQLKAAHAKVKTGADFPSYIQEIKKLGLITYEFRVADGVVTYYGAAGHQITSPATYPPQLINAAADAAGLRQTIAIHKQGRTDFRTFCEQAAAAGVEKWIIDTQQMVCNYIDLDGKLLIAEPIPQDNY